MSGTGLEEKLENMNVEEKEPKARKGGEKAKGEKKKKEDTGGGFPLEVSFETILRSIMPYPLYKFVHSKILFFLWTNFKLFFR